MTSHGTSLKKMMTFMMRSQNNFCHNLTTLTIASLRMMRHDTPHAIRWAGILHSGGIGTAQTTSIETVRAIFFAGSRGVATPICTVGECDVVSGAWRFNIAVRTCCFGCDGDYQKEEEEGEERHCIVFGSIVIIGFCHFHTGDFV
jgi:hypothetical protein